LGEQSLDDWIAGVVDGAKRRLAGESIVPENQTDVSKAHFPNPCVWSVDPLGHDETQPAD
jgi:hypothetical protein